LFRFFDKSRESRTLPSAAKRFYGVSGCFFAFSAQKNNRSPPQDFFGGVAAVSKSRDLSENHCLFTQ